jgi:predicted nuclease of predicted toxin-antitoxin system
MKLLLDEHVQIALARALRQQAFDVLTVAESGRRSLSDEAQLEWAIQQGRTFFTYNVGDFVRLHNRWQEHGWEHHGIIVSRQLSVKEVLRRLNNLLRKRTPAEMLNRLEFLSDWA